MGWLDKKIRSLEQSDDMLESDNLYKVTSDKIADTIKEMSGESNTDNYTIPDNVVMFTNACGGSGATTVAVNVASELTRRKLSVLMIDLNINNPQLHVYLGIQQEIKAPDLVSYLTGEKELGECINSKKRINLLFANNRNILDNVRCQEKVTVHNFETMIEKVRKLYDVIIIDCPMRIDVRLCNSAMYLADAIYMVWDDGIGSINTEPIRRDMALTGIDCYTKMKLIVNKRTNVRFTDYGPKKLNTELIQVLPFTTDVIEAGLQGKIFCEAGDAMRKESPIFANGIIKLADRVLQIAGYVR